MLRATNITLAPAGGAVADIISIEDSNKLIVGATQNVFYNKSGEIGTWSKETGEKGKWNVYQNGKVIKSYNWNWKPSAKDLNSIKKK